MRGVLIAVALVVSSTVYAAAPSQQAGTVTPAAGPTLQEMIVGDWRGSFIYADHARNFGQADVVMRFSAYGHLSMTVGAYRVNDSATGGSALDADYAVVGPNVILSLYSTTQSRMAILTGVQVKNGRLEFVIPNRLFSGLVLGLNELPEGGYSLTRR